jgi:hypothetical protein
MGPPAGCLLGCRCAGLRHAGQFASVHIQALESSKIKAYSCRGCRSIKRRDDIVRAQGKLLLVACDGTTWCLVTLSHQLHGWSATGAQPYVKTGCYTNSSALSACRGRARGGKDVAAASAA